MCKYTPKFNLKRNNDSSFQMSPLVKPRVCVAAGTEDSPAATLACLSSLLTCSTRSIGAFLPIPCVCRRVRCCWDRGLPCALQLPSHAYAWLLLLTCSTHSIGTVRSTDCVVGEGGITLKIAVYLGVPRSTSEYLWVPRRSLECGVLQAHPGVFKWRARSRFEFFIQTRLPHRR